MSRNLPKRNSWREIIDSPVQGRSLLASSRQSTLIRVGIKAGRGWYSDTPGHFDFICYATLLLPQQGILGRTRDAQLCLVRF